ncbi:MAG: hypothetical protein WC869_01020 [Phycisphaerae bacterium]|jgi:hypothetical protein
MIGPLQQRLLRMMEFGKGVTAADLHKTLIRDMGDKSPSYSTVLSVLRNLAKRRPDLLVSEKIKQQLVFTMQVPLVRVLENELHQFVGGLNWTGSSTAFLQAVSRMPRLPAGIQAAISKEIDSHEAAP